MCEFLHKKGGVIQFYLSECLACICVFCFISTSIVYFSWEELTVTESNQQIYDFCKWVIFKKQRYCGKKIFDISELFIQFNALSCSKHITGGVNIYLYGCVSLLGGVLCLCLCVCVISNLILCQTSITLTPCCIKHTARSFLY